MDPPEKTTTPISKEEVQTGLLNKLVSTVTEIRDEQRQLRADVGLVASDLSVVKDRVSVVESRTTALEGRADTGSMRAKSQSELDAAQSAQLAQERSAREELSKKVDDIALQTSTQTAILNRLDHLTANPTVKLIAHAIGVALLYWLASKGIKL